MSELVWVASVVSSTLMMTRPLAWLAVLVRVKSPFWTVWIPVPSDPPPQPKSPCSQTFKGLPARNSCSECIMEEKKGRYNHGVVCLLHTDTSSELLHYRLSGEKAHGGNFLSSRFFSFCGRFKFHPRPNSQVLSFFFFLRRQWKLYLYCTGIKYVNEYRICENLALCRPLQEDLLFVFLSNVHSYSELVWNSLLRKISLSL